jgi:hypothetical protein
MLLPKVVHRAIRRAENIGAIRDEERSALVEAAARRRGAERLFTGAALLIAGVIWTGLGTQPPWVGWTAAGAGLVLMFLPARPRGG